MRIVSWNLLHTTGAKGEDISRLIAATRPDLLVMQEAEAALDALPRQLGGSYARLPLPGRHHGLAVWSPGAFTTVAGGLTLPRGLIVQRCSQIIDFGGLTVANVHLSHGQVLNRRQLRRIADAIPHRAVILGDCNMVGAALLPGFDDVGAREATHLMGGVVPLRLDRCFLRGVVCREARVLAFGASDHRPMVIDLAV
ncbi:endonuclease/exonuclease/phosphatase family protein [Novosphingobium sp.]|uniref:endonuclease/exonuclease/phosphatase family protein n=1 Tax=Novosphingobium sp. TaxID=1874826 RepID=UPI003B51713E